MGVFKNKYHTYPNIHNLENCLANIKQRCLNPKNPRYKDYGARGIGICEEWKNNHESFYKWAYENGYKQGLTIDRIDNNKGYYPENCRWVPYAVNTSNRRTVYQVPFGDELLTLSELSRRTGTPRTTLYAKALKGAFQQYKT